MERRTETSKGTDQRKIEQTMQRVTFSITTVGKRGFDIMLHFAWLLPHNVMTYCRRHDLTNLRVQVWLLDPTSLGMVSSKLNTVITLIHKPAR